MGDSKIITNIGKKVPIFLKTCYMHLLPCLLGGSLTPKYGPGKKHCQEISACLKKGGGRAITWMIVINLLANLLPPKHASSSGEASALHEVLLSYPYILLVAKVKG